VRRENEIGQHPATIIVDVANVMGSRPDGWWRDRAAAAARLHAEITPLAAEGTAGGQPVLPGETGPPQFVMVLEGAARAAATRIHAAERVRVVQANGSGDDEIAALVRELPGRRRFGPPPRGRLPPAPSRTAAVRSRWRCPPPPGRCPPPPGR